MEQAMTDDNLPPLPRPGHLKVHTDSEGVPYWDEPLYTATQVEEIRRAALAALERLGATAFGAAP